MGSGLILRFMVTPAAAAASHQLQLQFQQLQLRPPSSSHKISSKLKLKLIGPTYSRVTPSIVAVTCRRRRSFNASSSALIISSHSSSLLRCSSSMELEAPPPEGYRKNVGICLLNPSNRRIFAASRIDIPTAWQMPQGGVDNGEDPRAAVLRELKEETGITSVDILAEVPYWLTYDFPADIKEKLNKLWGSSWNGQAQKWFLLKFMGTDEEINLNGSDSETAEFSDWAWRLPQEIIDHAVDFKKPVYEEVLRFFTPYMECNEAATS